MLLRSILLAAILLALMPAKKALSVTNSPFNGVWLMDVDSLLAASDPDVFVVTDGKFSRGTGENLVTVKADGRFHQVRSDPEPYTIAAMIVNRRRLRTEDRKNGEVVYRAKYDVTADGNTLTTEMLSYDRPDHQPVKTTGTFRRIGAAPRVGNLLSGRWRPTRWVRDKHYLTEVIRIDGDRFRSDRGGGLRYEATIGGPPATVPGGNGEVSVTMPSARVVKLRWFDQGKPTFSLTMTMLPGDQVVDVQGRRSDGTATHWRLRRQ
jgi:hypothetical protein